MSGVVRKVFGCLCRLWLCLAEVLCRLKRREVAGGNGEKNKRTDFREETHDMNWNAEGWDEFSVTVVPNMAVCVEQSNNEQEAQHSPSQDFVEEDLFQDMKPVFRKPQKIHRDSSGGTLEEQRVNLSKFAVQDSLFREELAGELGAWSEDEETGDRGGGWGEHQDLLTNSQAALKMKRANDRDRRRKAQVELRGQQRIAVAEGGTNNLRLGTRVH